MVYTVSWGISALLFYATLKLEVLSPQSLVACTSEKMVAEKKHDTYSPTDCKNDDNWFQ